MFLHAVGQRRVQCEAASGSAGRAGRGEPGTAGAALPGLQRPLDRDANLPCALGSKAATECTAATSLTSTWPKPAVTRDGQQGPGHGGTGALQLLHSRTMMHTHRAPSLGKLQTPGAPLTNQGARQRELAPDDLVEEGHALACRQSRAPEARANHRHVRWQGPCANVSATSARSAPPPTVAASNRRRPVDDGRVDHDLQGVTQGGRTGQAARS